MGVEVAALPDVVRHDASDRLRHDFTGAPDLDVLEEGGELAVALGRVLLLHTLLVPDGVVLVQGVELTTSFQIKVEPKPAEISRQDLNRSQAYSC